MSLYLIQQIINCIKGEKHLGSVIKVVSVEY